MIWRWIERHAQERPEAPALRFEGRRIAYADLARRVAAAAAGLAARGIGHGDRVAFLGPNHPSQIVLLFACARLGAMQLPLNWRLAPPELGFILADAGATALAATREMLDLARRIAPP
ncbi:MAG: AMP-binding protein, partial [Acetobacteraceae bacterium]|nr:AMP-binding protein [Acetobacteraceae bacterium]